MYIVKCPNCDIEVQPTMNTSQIMWTVILCVLLLPAGIIYAACCNKQTCPHCKCYIPKYKIISANESSTASETTNIDKLNKYWELYKAGMLTKQEYEQKHKELMKK